VRRFHVASLASSILGILLLANRGVASAADDETIELNVGNPAPTFETEDDRIPG
jgi:hypothetical protein